MAIEPSRYESGISFWYTSAIDDNASPFTISRLLMPLISMLMVQIPNGYCSSAMVFSKETCPYILAADRPSNGRRLILNQV